MNIYGLTIEEMEDYFVDECGVFYEEDRHYLINDSVEYLYEKTGVKVFIYISYLIHHLPP